MRYLRPTMCDTMVLLRFGNGQACVQVGACVDNRSSALGCASAPAVTVPSSLADRGSIAC